MYKFIKNIDYVMNLLPDIDLLVYLKYIFLLVIILKILQAFLLFVRIQNCRCSEEQASSNRPKLKKLATIRVNEDNNKQNLVQKDRYQEETKQSNKYTKTINDSPKMISSIVKDDLQMPLIPESAAKNSDYQLHETASNNSVSSGEETEQSNLSREKDHGSDNLTECTEEEMSKSIKDPICSIQQAQNQKQMKIIIQYGIIQLNQIQIVIKLKNIWPESHKNHQSNPQQCFSVNRPDKYGQPSNKFTIERSSTIR